MCQMSAMCQIHSHKCIARLQNSEEYCHICLCTGMWLNIDIFTSKQLLCTLSCKIFHYIDILTSAIITLSRISLCVLVRKRTSHSCHNCLGYDIL